MGLKILFAASEVAPFAKTGGLADVAGSLPLALKDLGHDVRVVMPYYQSVRDGGFLVSKLEADIAVPMGDRIVRAAILEGRLDRRVPVYFLEHNDYYQREELYRTKHGDYPDNAERFLFFSKAILDIPGKTDFIPDIFHCNDWQTGLAPLLLSYGHREDSRLAASRSVFTIHNMAYQGIFWHLDMPLLNLGWEVFTPEILEFYGKINLLKAGLAGADLITTVSKKYAQEIQTQEFGCGLEGVLHARKKDLCGIVNGVDYDQWSPEKDNLIAQHYSPAEMRGKTACREDLLAHFGLNAEPHEPIVGMISRLADQKGLDLLAGALEAILDTGALLIVLGNGEEQYHAMLKNAQEHHPGHIGLHLGFDDSLAHKIEAGCDIFLMPSRFEPCGLNQMYSMKYGTIPLVHATGGLDDTVRDYNAATGEGNGFKFSEYNVQSLLSKFSEAMQVFKQPSAWRKLMQNAMACDYSWHHSATEYEKVYAMALNNKRRTIAAI